MTQKVSTLGLELSIVMETQIFRRNILSMLTISREQSKAIR